MIIIRKFRSLYLKIRLLFFWYLSQISKYSIICKLFKGLRVQIWKITGCNIGKGVYIGWDVYHDVSNAHLITLEDDVTITSKVLILCHRRNMSKYFKHSRYNDLPYIKKAVLIKKGASIGMGSIILPGVTIGEGSIIGAGSVVTKDIPEWSIAAGVPAKVLQSIK